MELFKVQCVTCQAKLSVRNEALIGQIVACPRCESMVEVVRPQSASAPAAAAAAALVDDPPAEPPVESAESIDIASETPVEEATESFVSAEMLQASAEVARYKLITWSLASFTIGAALIGGVLLTRGGSSVDTGSPAPSPGHTADDVAPADPMPITVDLPAPQEPMAEESGVDEAQHDGKPAKLAPTNTDEKSDAELQVAETTVPSPPVTPTDVESDESAPTSPEPAPRLARRLEPFEFDPESVSLESIDQPTPDTYLPEPAAPDPPATVVEEIASTAPLARRGPESGEEVGKRDAAKQLALLVPAMKFADMPFVDCLRLFSQLSGVPVSVSPDQLVMAGITAEKRVSLDASASSVSQMLDQVLAPLRLEYETRGEQAVVVRQDRAKQREINYPIDDLITAETNAEQLAGWVEQMVAPSTWEAVGGAGTIESAAGKLRVSQTQQVQYQVLIMLERLRLARKLRPRSRYPVERLAGAPVQLLLEEKLATSATFTFSQFAPIDEVFVHWQTELDAPLLIDWPALAEAEVWPTTTIACAIIDQPWSEALEKVLEPLGLGWRAATGGAIEITTAEKVQGELLLELYPLRRDVDGDQLAEVAKPRAAGAVVYDSVGNVLLSLQPAAEQREIIQRLRDGQMLLAE